MSFLPGDIDRRYRDAVDNARVLVRELERLLTNNIHDLEPEEQRALRNEWQALQASLSVIVHSQSEYGRLRDTIVKRQDAEEQTDPHIRVDRWTTSRK